MMNMEIDYFEILRLTESCFGNSTAVGMGFITKVIDYHDAFTKEERLQLFKMLCQIKKHARNSMDHKIIARFDPEEQYKIETANHGCMDAFKYEDQYFVNAHWRISDDQIVKFEKLK